ncbi:MAG: hypothetical protein K2G77_06490 [Muribaculaceae bacterium]|nr:hypothetical protein [Muribaculaceae bacterium]
MRFNSLALRISGPALLVGLLIISLLGGCRQSFDQLLSKADSMMEEHPDSSLMILADYHLAPGTSAADSAYYALLLTHARYKNFIDETDDSLISLATKYFLAHNDQEKAARALFLQGMIQLNAQRLGEAAVSFKQGLDIAHDNNHYMWEGQCARGLSIIYDRLKNYSQQIIYAQIEYDAFIKGGNIDWSNYAKLNILRAYNNNEKYDNVLKEALMLLHNAEETKDTLLIEEVLVFIGTCRYTIGDFKGALESYYRAYSMDPSVIRATHGYNVAVSADNIQMDSLTDGMRKFIEAMELRKETLPAFKVLANQGRFEEAFLGLERYKNLQDSILQVIVRNNVSESIGHYEDTMAILHQKEVRIERILWGSGFLMLVIIIVVSYWVYKKNLYHKELERRDVELSIEMLRTDLASQLAQMDEMTADIQGINKRNEQMSCALRDLLYERYKKINDLCDSYYQDRFVTSKKNKLDKEIEKILKDFSDKNFLNEVGGYIDLCLDGLYTSFSEDYNDLNDDTKRLFMFLTMGLSNRSLCVLFNIDSSILYNRKSRLKKFIANSNVKRKAEYLKNIQ